MKTLFRNTGYKLFTKQEENSKKISFSYIKNPDGTVRWFWNSDSSKPLFLKFYNAATPKAKLFEVLVKTVFAMRLQKIVFKKEVLYYVKNSQPVLISKTTGLFLQELLVPTIRHFCSAEDIFTRLRKQILLKS